MSDETQWMDIMDLPPSPGRCMAKFVPPDMSGPVQCHGPAGHAQEEHEHFSWRWLSSGEWWGLSFGPRFNFASSTWLSSKKLMATRLQANRTHKATCQHGAAWFMDCDVCLEFGLYVAAKPWILDRIAAARKRAEDEFDWERYRNGIGK